MIDYFVELVSQKGTVIHTKFFTEEAALLAVRNVEEGKSVDGVVWFTAHYLGPYKEC